MMEKGDEGGLGASETVAVRVRMRSFAKSVSSDSGLVINKV
jgi:hypothetical protein